MILGSDRLKDNLRVIGLRATKSAKEGMREIAAITGADAVENTPLLTGDLRGTLQITEESRGLGFRITMGGPDADYAVVVHEDLEAHHPIGGPKFLENAMARTSSIMLERVGGAIHLG